VIDVIELCKNFDGVQALDGLNIHVPEAAVYGLVGPNGAGKSTVIRHLTGVYRADSGQVLIDGENVYESPSVKAKYAYIPDDVYSFPQASINEMMKFYAGIYPRFDRARFEKLSEVFALDRKTPMRRLSKGMQKQAAFWIAVSLRPQVLILDEPVDGLDPVMRRQVWSLIMSDVAENGTTVLVSSHNLRELEDVCDHVGIMNSGKLLLERALDELQENIIKIQVALPEGRELPDGIDIMHLSSAGRLHTIIARGNLDEIIGKLQEAEPLLMERMPLSLEEIFIYELGGENYGVKDIIL